MRYTEYHADKAVIKDKALLPDAMDKLAKIEDLEEKNTDIDQITTEMMEYICDSVCKHSNNAMLLQEELDGFCAECKMGNFVCDILNTYNRLNDFEKSQSHDLLKKLSEYRNLEEQGLLLKLPCKVGDVVYEFVEKIGKKGHWEEDKYFVDEWEKNIIREREFNLYMLASGEFGKTIFLTEQEAQAALEKMEGE